MQDVLQLMLSLEKIKRPENERYIVYSYVLAPPQEKKSSQPAGFFIPLHIAPNKEKADELAEDIIKVTGYPDVMTYPMGLWISLGDKQSEEISIVTHHELKEHADREEERKQRLAQERKQIEAEVRAEQEAMTDPDSIEAYYYDWFCTVQNKAHLDYLEAQVKQANDAYRHRLNSLVTKAKLHPEYKDKWQALLLERLEKRGEKDHAQHVICAARAINENEGLNL